MRSLFRIILIVFCMSIFILPAAAQDDTAQPNQAFILGWSNEVIFPQAIRFTVTVARPLTDLARATLRIQPAGGDAISVDVDLAQAAVVSEPYSELAYIWQIPRNAPPRLFQSITFDWQVVSRVDEVAQIRDSLIFTDQRAVWAQGAGADGRLNLTIPDIGPSGDTAQIAPGEQLGPATPMINLTAAPEATMEVTTLEPLTGADILTPAFSLIPGGPQPTTDAPDTTGVRLLLTGLEPVYDLLAANTDSSPSFNIMIYTGDFPPGCVQNDAGESVAIGPYSGVEIACDAGMAGLILRESGFDLVQSASSSLNVIEADLTAYLVNEFYQPLWAGKDVPAWFAAGLTQLYTDTLKTTAYPPLLAAARADNLFALPEMASDPSGATNAALWQAQSYGMVVYIADQLGLPGLFALARNIGDADSFEAAVQSALGRQLSAVLSDFRRWVFTSQAASAFGFTPYQAATLSPTPSRTPTFTPTPTATLTLTPTLTPSVTGVLTNTPTVTPFPSSTPTPEPPTPTPRPPGSLNTLTPTPVPSQIVNPVSSLSSPTVALGILTIGLVIIAVFALMFMRFRGK